MSFDIYVWSEPRDLDADAVETLLRGWQEAGGDPAASPFEPSTNVGWFHRELTRDQPGLEVSSDAVPSTSTRPVWLSTDDEPPARVVGVNIPRDDEDAARDALEDIWGLAAKYDLVVYEVGRQAIHLPLKEIGDYASATFWPRGAIQAGVVGGMAGIVAVVAWLLAIPVVSGIVALIAGFMFVLAVLTFVAEGRNTIRERRAGDER
ncbi:MAG TPA: hypothetical protein VFO05_16650 [Candidatus Limnocylindrales bacterium]|nr:hypothetical protein [Candidatus Limnocylindrales bacterium]